MRRRILLQTLIYQGKSAIITSTHPPLSRSPFPAREGFKEFDKSKFENKRTASAFAEAVVF